MTTGMDAEELPELSLREWIDLTGRETAPFGDETEGIVWRPKDRHLGLRDEDGKLIAAGGLIVTTVRVDGQEVEVVGVGTLIVAPEWRHRGVMPLVADPLARLAEALGPDFAMIFCREALVPLYEARDYRRIEAPVRVDQPSGRITMPIPAMWRPLRDGVTWPDGPIEVDGEPF